MRYVIGADCGSTKCLIKEKDFEGNLLATSMGKTTNHLLIGLNEAKRRIVKQVNDLIASFNGKKEDCACIVVGAAGIDSAKDKEIIYGFYNSLVVNCPIFCMNDGNLALYSATKGVGIQAISGTGSIVVGRNAEGMVTRSGGYPATIFGNEGSSQWIAYNALNYASKYLDKSVESSLLIELIDDYFNGLNVNKLIDCAISLRQRPVDSKLAVLVCEAAKGGDQAAIAIQEKGARELADVAETCVKKLGFDRESEFLAGVWGSVFEKNKLFFKSYQQELTSRYPNCKVVFPEGDAADGAVGLAYDCLQGKVEFINDLL